MGMASAFTPGPGDQAIAKASLPLRTTPPQDSYVVIKGQQVGMIQPGETVTIEATQEVKGLFRKDTWVKIKRQGSTGNAQSGWVFFGTNGESSNFEKRN